MNNLGYDKTSPKSIFEYAIPLLDHTLREMVGDEAVHGYNMKGKGTLGQMVEELYYHYKVNSNPSPDFEEAGVELKTTGLKRLKDLSLQIKERLVVDMIDYNEVVNQSFEMSLFYNKCRLMLLLFYLYDGSLEQYDRLFLYLALWKIPEKDLLMIKHDYEVIIEKIKRGEAHLLSEGDTEYLGACRKGQKGDSLRKQPNSEIGAPRRAFSLKTAYMRTVLQYIKDSGKRAVVNYEFEGEQVVQTSELQERPFDEIILSRFAPYIGKDYKEICALLNKKESRSKAKYFDIANSIVSPDVSNVNRSEEFMKAGLTMKTIRVEGNGSINESMSFENIDYEEVYDNENWYDSRLYEMFTSRFLFVVYRQDPNRKIVVNGKEEKRYFLDKVFFWTMPLDDVDLAEQYWLNIRESVLKNHIDPLYFWKIKDHKKFHVRPKGRVAADLAYNPNGGYAKKYCYWFNSEYVKNIIENNG
ncbi:MAG: hypothetical protein K6C10_08710 [Prevotella sp.]|nr:hypothetical protein [Prevotella sp.]